MAKGITLQELDSTATSRLVIKDSAGRAKVTAPLAADDIALKSTVDNAVGNLSTLQTTDKSNVVKAINELFTNVSNGKSSIAAAITGKGVAASGSDTFDQLATKIGQIVTGRRWADGTQIVYPNQFLRFSTKNNKEPNLSYVSVSGLSFTPSVIILRRADKDVSTTYCAIYYKDIAVMEDPQASILVFSTDYYDGLRSLAPAFLLTGNATVSNGFVLPITVSSSANMNWYWLAIE